jgi:hypothetical protein
LGKNPNRGGSPDIDKTDKKNPTKIVGLVVNVLILLINKVFIVNRDWAK